jgi:hypothetical protein
LNQKDKVDYITYFLKWEYYLNQFIELRDSKISSKKENPDLKKDFVTHMISYEKMMREISNPELFDKF